MWARGIHKDQTTQLLVVTLVLATSQTHLFNKLQCVTAANFFKGGSTACVCFSGVISVWLSDLNWVLCFLLLSEDSPLFSFISSVSHDEDTMKIFMLFLFCYVVSSGKIKFHIFH